MKTWGSVAIAVLDHALFLPAKLRGIHESSGKALKIMIATTDHGASSSVWCGVTLAVQGPDEPDAHLARPDPQPDPEHRSDRQAGSPLGLYGTTPVGDKLLGLPVRRQDWLSMVGMFGILIAFGHSILAMSGEETLAQVYREVEVPS